jgi:hypothetical protein
MSSPTLSSSPGFKDLPGPDQPTLPITPANPSAVQQPILTRLRPRRHKVVMPVPTTPKRPRQRRCRRNSSSPPRPQSSPYRLGQSSPYVFDNEFYNSSQILNSNVSPRVATYGATSNRHMKHLRRAHEAIIDSAVLAKGFEPLDMPNPPRPLRTRLPDSCDITDPASFFYLFFDDRQFDIFAVNTNRYAIKWLAEHPTNLCYKHWQPTYRQEIKTYIAILIFLGLQGNSRPEDHWDKPAKDSPIHRMKWGRYKLIIKFFKISDVNKDQDNVLEDWHHKLTPLDTHLQERFQAVVVLGSNISYDEMMIPYRGRSAHVTKCPGKPDPDGYKNWALAEKGYLYDWLYYSGSVGKCSCFPVK